MTKRLAASADRRGATVRLALALCSSLLVAAGPALPAKLVQQLPQGYVVLSTSGLVVVPGRAFLVVALARRDEDRAGRSGAAPARPLVVYERRPAGAFVEVGRNDHVVLAADEGGQCDPFMDGGGTIAVRGRFFTVENGVACGQHWTDYVTFRFDGAHGFVFDNERLESWSLNGSDAPDAEALVRDGPQRVLRDRPGHLTGFSEWRPQR